MKHLQLKFSLLLLSLQLYCAAAENAWDKRAACGGSKRERGIGFVIGNRGYAGLGQDTLNLMCNDFWEYDPGTNSWTQKATFPGQARRDAACFAIGNKGYVGTGINNADAFAGTILSDFWEYSPATNSWTPKAAFPGGFGGGVYYSTGFAVLGKGYLCCGKLGASSYSSQLWQYDPGTNIWSSKAPFPGTQRYGGVAFVIGNYAYFGTGTDENVFTSDFYRYDPAMNSWSPIAAFPGSPRFSCSSFVLNGNGYIVFGTDGGYKDQLWMYVPADNYWYEKAAYPGGARRSGIAFTINNRAYAGTGKGLSGTRRDFWEYTPMTPVDISENEKLISSVYPNPVTEYANVSLSPELLSKYPSLQWKLTDMQGKVMETDKVESNEFRISRNDLPAGVYMLSFYSEGEMTGTKKLIVQ